MTSAMAYSQVLLLLISLTNWSIGQVLRDPDVYGPTLEEVHLYYGQWPTGITVSSSGRMFSNYPPGLDANNTNDGSNGKFTVAELTSRTEERAFPNVAWNNPPGGQINYTTTPPSGANYQDRLIGVQSVVVDSRDRLWILDTGRALTSNGTLVLATFGGPKLVGVDLTNNDTVFQTIILPQNVAYPDSYLNDVRIDLRPSITSSGRGVAYITDSSLEGRNGIIVVDLGTGESWRHLDGSRYVKPETGFVAFIYGQQIYSLDAATKQIRTVGFGSDGIALSADGENLYFGPVASRYLYSVPTQLLRRRDAVSELLVVQGVRDHGQKGVSDGFETDSNGNIYAGNMEQNSIAAYHPENGTVTTFVRDSRINWADTLSVGADGYLYFTNNQLWLSSSFYPGSERRVRPFELLRAKLPSGGRKAGQ